MKAIKRAIAWCGIGLFGRVRWLSFLVNIGNISKNAYYDRLAEEVMRRVWTDDSVCVDVGCNEGLVLEQMMRLAPRGRFLACEPLADLYERLCRRFSSPQVTVYPIALSDAEGLSAFNYVVSNPAYSGLKKRRYDRPDENDTEIQVRTQTLDSLLACESIEHIDYIKVDVEGAEYLVFKGAVNCLKRDKPVVVFEHGKGAADCYGVGPEAVHGLLCGECKLRIFLLSDWLLGKKPLTQTQFCRQFHTGRNYYCLACR